MIDRIINDNNLTGTIPYNLHKMKKIAVFASGTGTNAENLAKVFNKGSRIRVDLLIVDREGAPALERLERLGVESVYIPRKEWKSDPQRIVRMLRERGIDIIALAGFLQIVGEEIVEAYPGRILNLHPSLLPAYGGKGFWGHNVHEAVLANGEKKSGATVHIVTKEIDRGPIVLQKEVEIEEGETPETLEQKVHQAEYDIYPRAVVKLLTDLENKAEEEAVAAGVEFEEANDAVPGEGKEDKGLVVNTTSAPEKPSADEYSNEKEWAKALGIDFKPGKKVETHEVEERKEEPRKAEEPKTAMPPTYLVPSILATILCCVIPGIVAIVFSSMVSTKYYTGDYEGAARASRRAEIWIIASIVFGLVVNTLMLPLMLFGN